MSKVRLCPNGHNLDEHRCKLDRYGCRRCAGDTVYCDACKEPLPLSSNPPKLYTEEEAMALVAAAYEVAAIKVEAHCCVSSCCDAQPSAGEAKALADCLRRAPADAMACLDAMLAKAREEGERSADERWAAALDHADWDGGVFHHEGRVYPWPRGFVPDCPATWSTKIEEARADGAAKERESCARECERNIPQARIDAWQDHRGYEVTTVDQASALALANRIRARRGA